MGGISILEPNTNPNAPPDFVFGSSGVSGVDLTPATAITRYGTHLQLNAAVSGSGTFGTDVTWSVNDPINASVSAFGVFVCNSISNADRTFVVTASSVDTPAITDSCVVTVKAFSGIYFSTANNPLLSAMRDGYLIGDGLSGTFEVSSKTTTFGDPASNYATIICDYLYNAGNLNITPDKQRVVIPVETIFSSVAGGFFVSTTFQFSQSADGVTWSNCTDSGASGFVSNVAGSQNIVFDWSGGVRYLRITIFQVIS